MPRAAGSSSTYEWRLYNKATKKYDADDTIDLISVTHVIGQTLGKPQMVPWTFYKNVDYIAGFIEWARRQEAGVLQFDEENGMDLLDYLDDADALRDLLKQYRMRTEDTTEDASISGQFYHTEYEKLAQYALKVAPEEAEIRAKRLCAKYTDQRAAIGDWWLTRKPVVLAAEKKVKSLVHGYAGTLDLAWVDEEGRRTLTDLKNRAEEKEVYDSDRVQLDAYEIAWTEREAYAIDRSTVLVARADGSFYEEEVSIPRGTFLDLLQVYKNLRTGRQ